ncbi:hypothetical protein J7E87_21465 [Streptomyces sp. ISL-1]|uniref:hypothetical protein n=1 Tax=Streptomyces sp. ISL-1 TaxID=2817657 RepID=UPI001BECE3EF|nr:hypothetical protein [Streptomyces sp. ISL-1]MBT2391928.1 hypothetical protein [Streptomyces sp. ISL-1]
MLRAAEYHRKQIREALKFRPSTLGGEESLVKWLAAEVCPVELVEDRQREALLVEWARISGGWCLAVPCGAALPDQGRAA